MVHSAYLSSFMQMEESHKAELQYKVRKIQMIELDCKLFPIGTRVVPTRIGPTVWFSPKFRLAAAADIPPKPGVKTIH